jgi:hypothetical protein
MDPHPELAEIHASRIAGPTACDACFYGAGYNDALDDVEALNPDALSGSAMALAIDNHIAARVAERVLTLRRWEELYRKANNTTLALNCQCRRLELERLHRTLQGS